MMATEGLSVRVACRVLGVSESGYDAWHKRPISARAVRQAWLTDRIRAVHVASRGTYGARRVRAELVLGQGIRVGHQVIERLMRRPASRVCRAVPATGSPPRRPPPRIGSVASLGARHETSCG
jgi:putative transposase